MDTTESMKSDTPQPAAKEQSPQKEQDNTIAGMSRLNVYFTLALFVFESTFKQKIINLTHAFEYVFDCV